MDGWSHKGHWLQSLARLAAGPSERTGTFFEDSVATALPASTSKHTPQVQVREEMHGPRGGLTPRHKWDRDLTLYLTEKTLFSQNLLEPTTHLSYIVSVRIE